MRYSEGGGGIACEEDRFVKMKKKKKRSNAKPHAKNPLMFVLCIES